MNALSGTSALLGLALRRDRLRLSAYLLGLAALMAGFLEMQAGQPRQALVEEAELFAGTPAMRMFGVASGVSVGAVTLIRGYLLLAVLAALMSTLAVVRHTRQNEETGRAELIGAAVVGRHAGLAAAVVLTVGADVVLAGLLGLAGIVAGQPAAGSFTAGVAVGGFGIVFGGVAAVTVQLSSTTRGANGLAAAALGLAFVLSGVGNMLGTVDASGVRLVSAWPAWLSPLGWGQQMRPFGGDHWGPLGLSASPSSCSSARRACWQLGETSAAACSLSDVGPLRPRLGSSARSGSYGGCSAAPCSVGRSLWPVSASSSVPSSTRSRTRAVPRPSGTRAWAAPTRSWTPTARRSSR